MAVEVTKKPRDKPVVLPPRTDFANTLPLLKLEDEFDFSEDDGFKPITDSVPVLTHANTPSPTRTTPKFPSKSVKPEDWRLVFDWLASLTVDDWKVISCYLYRTWPVIDRKISDPRANKYIECIGASFTLEDLLRNHGEGSYQLVVNDSSKAIAGKGGTLGIAYFNFRGSLYPEPKLRLDELDILAKENKIYVDRLVAEGKITTDGRVAMTPSNNNAANDPKLMQLVADLVSQLTKQQASVPKDTTQESISTMFMKTHEQSMQLLKDQLKGDDPEKWIKIGAMLLPLLQRPDTSSSMLETVMKLQSDAQARESTLMMKMMELVSAKKEDDSGGLDKQIDLLIKLKELTGGEQAAPKRSTLEVAMEAIAPVAFKGLEIIANILTMQNYKKGLANQNAATASTETNQGQMPQLTETQAAPDNVVEMPAPPADQFAQLLRQYGGFIIDGLNRGQTGDQFAETIENLLGKIAYDEMAAVGVENIMASMKTVPEFWDKVKGIAPKVEEFVREFVAYGSEVGPEETE